jgi:hypothetical protein
MLNDELEELMAFGEGAGQEVGNKSWEPKEKSLWLIAYGIKRTRLS